MKKSLTVFAWALTLAAGFPALADVEADASPVLLCSITDVRECIRGQECLEVLPEEINAPQFFRVDPDKRLLSSTKASGEGRTSEVSTWKV